MRVYFDIETYSPVDLPKTGVYRYAQHPDFLILMCAWSIDGGPVYSTHDQADTVAEFRRLWDAGATFVAHNAQFERVCFSAVLDFEVGEYLDPRRFDDTQARAGTWGYPQKLEHLGPALGGAKKDEAGTRLINIFSKPNRKGERTLPGDKPMEWLDFIDYCEQDVVTLIDVDQKLPDFPTDAEREIFYADQRANDAGIYIDVELATRAVAAAAENSVMQKLQVVEATNWTVENPNSVPQMVAWLAREGLPANNMQKDTVTRLLSGDLTADQRTVLELRQELALAAPKKYESALNAVLPDGRLRGTLKYFGAHTGRWAGRGTQVQNLPREAFMKVIPETGKAVWDEQAEIEAIRKLKRGEGGSSLDLKKLVRPLFTGPFTVVDYAAIEARVIAWLAGEEWALEAFRNGRDIYVETANRIGGLTRAEGKILVLALGFAGGVGSFRAMGGERADAMTDEEIYTMVRQWRHANANIVKLWAQLEMAFSDTGQVGPHLRITQSEDKMGVARHIHLPSGRSISYHDVRWEKYRITDPKTGQHIWKQGWRYADPKNPFNYNMRIPTYGGRLAENATQAAARDLMAASIPRLQEEGYTVVAHVHDEIIVEGEHDVDTIAALMCQVPGWAPGLPIDGEGFNCERYRKG